MKKKQSEQKLAKTKKKKLSIRDRKTIVGIMKGKSIDRSMRDAGFARTTARVKNSAKAKELAPTIQALMEKRGLTDSMLLGVLDDGLKANKVISCNIISQSGDGMADAHSMTKDFVDVDDHPTRHKFLETALKIKRHLDKPDEQAGVTIIINAEPHGKV